MSNKILIHINENQNITAFHKTPEDEANAEKETLVIMVHSFPGHMAGKADLFGEIENFLHKKNYHSVRFDFRGCGFSDGQEEHFTLASADEDLKQIMYWTQQEGYKKFIVIAEGIGATIALRRLSKNTSALVLLWPALDPEKYGQQLSSQGQKNKNEGFIDFFGYRVGQKLLTELAETDLIFELKKATMPTTIIHGSRDKLCTLQDMELIRKHLGAERAEITTYHNGDHGMTKKDLREALVRQIGRFMKDQA